ncbi:MAG: arsenosugar biosynthesis radical SAM protein ArsS [Coriobacteriales bacterium]|jgi:radical SAM/Cys-rich protein|nr:arsenosugar biosynthesis radical SAM protein ArsS [Coriobacteriales bacterium]
MDEFLSHLPFTERARQAGQAPSLKAETKMQTLQLNITDRCNLHCKHCHVSAGPDLADDMSDAVLGAVLQIVKNNNFSTVDITGGAPELHPRYRELVDALRQTDPALEIITRTNLVILTEPGYGDLPGFWAERRVRVVGSLPSWERQISERQRGLASFGPALAGLRALNTAGYAQPDSGLVLDLVSNPAGAYLPPSQASAEREYREHLGSAAGPDGAGPVSFSHLLTITNNPVGRFRDWLETAGQLDPYMERLYAAYNPATLPAMMCRSQVNVGLDGSLYDCDFNHVQDLPLLAADGKAALTVFDLAEQGLAALCGRDIRFAGHCYACTAGAGSSCGGATT